MTKLEKLQLIKENSKRIEEGLKFAKASSIDEKEIDALLNQQSLKIEELTNGGFIKKEIPVKKEVKKEKPQSELLEILGITSTINTPNRQVSTKEEIKKGENLMIDFFRA